MKISDGVDSFVGNRRGRVRVIGGEEFCSVSGERKKKSASLAKGRKRGGVSLGEGDGKLGGRAHTKFGNPK